MSSSSSSTVSATTVNGTTRFSGLSSGIDVDSLVQKLMTTEKTKLNKLKQEKQIDTWKQEQYRTIISDMTTFTNKYLNLTSSDSILNESNFLKFTSTSDNTAVSVNANANANAGNHTIKISQLATSGTQASAEGITKIVEASGAFNASSLGGTSFTMTVDGTTRTVSFDKEYTGSSSTDAVAYVQAAINEAVGTTVDSNGTTINKVTVGTDSSGYFTFTPTTNSGVGGITISAPSSDTVRSSLSALGFTSSSNLTNRLSTSDTLATVANKLQSSYSGFIDSTSGEIEFTINGQKFSFDKSDTLGEMISTVNENSSAGVTMKYDSNNDQLVLTANDTGSGKTITVADKTGSFMSTVMKTFTSGDDAVVTLDGQKLTRSSNAITQDGVTYTLNKASTETADISITQDTDGIYDTINNFVTAYNALLDEVNGKISETYDSDYQPLTDDQESSMSDTEITKWDTKAETGLLANDSTLSTMVNNMRQALMSSVSGVSEALTKIGITTSTYTEKGKLHVNDTTLKAAIADDPSGVMKLFTQSSTTYPGTTTVRTYNSSERKVRTSEEGIGYKLYDVLQDNIGTGRDSNGYKGLLIEKAGTTSDASESNNAISDDLDSLADKIDQEEDRLSNVEDRYYTEFTNMETALEKLSSQSSIISSFSSS